MRRSFGESERDVFLQGVAYGDHADELLTYIYPRELVPGRS